jgi:DNA polymerase III epsilon subunit-like protein
MISDDNTFLSEQTISSDTSTQNNNDGQINLIGENREYEKNILYIDLIPKKCWFKNVRSCIEPEDWNRLRKYIYARANYKCECCGINTIKNHTRIEAHERFEYDSDSKTQKLVRIIALCEKCHLVTHFGYAGVKGRREEAIEHFMKVRPQTKEELDKKIAVAFAIYRYRNTITWNLDLTLLTNNGFKLKKQNVKERIAELQSDKLERLKNNPVNIIDENILFFDIETSGMSYDDHIIELGWMICKNDGNIKKEESHIIKHENLIITNLEYQNITTDMMNKKGKPFGEVIKKFMEDVKNINIIVSHNIVFDKSRLFCECRKYNFTDYVDIIDKKISICTMKLSREKLRIDNHKLDTVYNYLFECEYEQKHRSLDDTRLCKDCYFKLIKMETLREKIKVKKNKKPIISWETRYQALKEYLEKNNNIYPSKNNNDINNKELNNWIAKQRCAYNTKSENSKHRKLTLEEKQKLEKLPNWCWNVCDCSSDKNINEYKPNNKCIVSLKNITIQYIKDKSYYVFRIRRKNENHQKMMLFNENNEEQVKKAIQNYATNYISHKVGNVSAQNINMINL